MGQERDTSTVGGALFKDDQFPLSPIELGLRLKRLRGRRTLRDVESYSDALGNRISRSALSRYESGVLPSLEVADVLDSAYEADGYVRESVVRLRIDGWDPWEQGGWSSTTFSYAWPAAMSGQVWVNLRPGLGGEGRPHVCTLTWGPWRRTVAQVLPPTGLFLVTGKAADLDGIPRTLNLKSDRRVFAVFGSGELPHDTAQLDIRDGWVLQDHQPGEENHGPQM